MERQRRPILRSAHDVAKREEHAAQQHDSQEQSNEMTAFQYPVTPSALSVSAGHDLFIPSECLRPLHYHVNRQRKNNRRVFLDADFRQRLQVAELDRSGLSLKHLRRLCQFCLLYTSRCV